MSTAAAIDASNAFDGTEGSYQFHLQKVLEKLQTAPGAITTDDARRVHEHYNAVDERSARVISAIEAVAAAHDDIAVEKGDVPSLKQAGHTSLHTLVQDLHVAVDKNPDGVTVEVLKLAQSIYQKMQKAIGTRNAPHPELEAELQEEYAKIEPKVEQGIVTKAEADHLHSLEARAHGHTEKGGLTAIAQSVAAKRERQLSLSEGVIQEPNPSEPRKAITPQEQSREDKEVNLHQVEEALRPKIENCPEEVTKENASLLESRERRAHGVIEKGSLAAEAQSLADKNTNLHQVEMAIRPKIDNQPETVTKEDAALPESPERRTHGVIEKGCMAPEVQSLADENNNQSSVSAH